MIGTLLFYLFFLVRHWQYKISYKFQQYQQVFYFQLQWDFQINLNAVKWINLAFCGCGAIIYKITLIQCRFYINIQTKKENCIALTQLNNNNYHWCLTLLVVKNWLELKAYFLININIFHDYVSNIIMFCKLVWFKVIEKFTVTTEETRHHDLPITQYIFKFSSTTYSLNAFHKTTIMQRCPKNYNHMPNHLTIKPQQQFSFKTNINLVSTLKQNSSAAEIDRIDIKYQKSL